MKQTSLRVFLLFVALTILPFVSFATTEKIPHFYNVRITAYEDTITLIINDKIKEIKPASSFPDSIRYQKNYLYDQDNKLSNKTEIVPVRTIKIYYIGKNGKLVDNPDDRIGSLHKTLFP